MSNELEARHIYGSAQVDANIEVALHALRQASSGYLAQACSPERTVYAETAAAVFDQIGNSLHSLTEAQKLLNVHLIAVTSDDPR